MNRVEFLSKLKFGLQGVDEYTLKDILNDYEEYFIHGAEEGKSEESICKELGTPKQIIKNLIEQGVIRKEQLLSYRNDVKSDGELNGLNVAILVILNIVLISILSPFVCGFLGILIGCVAMVPALIIAVIGSTIITGITLLPVVILITVLSIAILILIGMYFLCYGIVIILKRYIEWNKNFARGA